MKFFEKQKNLYKGALSVICGFTLIEIMFTYHSDYYMWQMIVYCLIGIGAVAFGSMVYLIPEFKKRKSQEVLFKDTDFAMAGPSNKLEKKLYDFRNDFAVFFTTKGIKENAPIQHDTTQYYKNILDLQKRRLDKLHVTLEFLSEKRRYVKPAVQKNTFFDGKYEITEVEEQVEAYRRYKRENNILFTRHDSEVAHYTLLNAKQVGDKRVICPNCGVETRREALIDGCDYCGTRFQVEDLGEKICDFAFRENYEVAYQKYKHYRNDYLSSAFIILFTACYLFCAFCVTILMPDEASGAGIGTTVSEATNPLFLLFGFVSVIGSFAGLISGAAMLVGVPVTLPTMEIGASLKYNTRKKLHKLKKAKQAERSKEGRVKKFDPLFSITGFYSNVQNKISVLLFDDRADLQFEHVIDYDVNRMELIDYKVEDGWQKARVDVNLQLYEIKGSKVKQKKQVMKIHLVKSAQCKTQAVCAPSVMICKNCGSSLSFADDFVCSYCGTKLDLKMYDWEICEIQ